jgi:hypothetical protein
MIKVGGHIMKRFIVTLLALSFFASGFTALAVLGSTASQEVKIGSAR